jgi:hypothetical protein
MQELDCVHYSRSGYTLKITILQVSTGNSICFEPVYIILKEHILCMICFVLQFDSGIQRFMSMRATEYDHFRPTPKTSLYGLCVIVIPMLAFGYWVKTTRVRYSHFSTY